MFELVLALLLCQEPPAAPAPQAPQTESSSFLDPLHGSLRVKYRYRATSTESDSDLYEILNLSYGNPDRDTISGALTARLAEDLDGHRNVAGFYPFTSLDDRRRSFATQRLYTAYLDARTTERQLSLRAGRQALDEIPEVVFMDGALVRCQPVPALTFAGFGGLPVNLFEPSPAGDAMYGGFAEWRPAGDARGRYRMEYLHVRDENLFGLHRDDLVGFSLDDGLGPLLAHVRYTMLEGKSRELVGRLSGSAPDTGFLFQAQATYVFHRIDTLSYALDPYAAFLMELQPYLDVSLRASKGFGQEFSLDLLFTSRQLVRNGTETTYNHEWKRFELSPTLRPSEDLSLRVSADYWDSSGNDFWTISGDLAWTIHRDIVLSAGSSYALYSVDAFTGEEHHRVRTYSVALKWKVSKQSSIDLRFGLEDNAADRFRLLEVGFRHAF